MGWMVSSTVILRTWAEAGDEDEKASRTKAIRDRDIVALIFLCASGKSFVFFELPGVDTSVGR